VGTTESEPTTANGTLLCGSALFIVEQHVAYDDLFILLDSLFILILVRRRLKDSDTVVVDISEDLPSAPYHWTRRQTHSLLEQANLLLGQSISLGNDGNQVDLLVKSPHELDIDWFEP
jgi:hypothetical protein